MMGTARESGKASSSTELQLEPVGAYQVNVEPLRINCTIKCKREKASPCLSWPSTGRSGWCLREHCDLMLTEWFSVRHALCLNESRLSDAKSSSNDKHPVFFQPSTETGEGSDPTSSTIRRRQKTPFSWSRASTVTRENHTSGLSPTHGYE